MPTFKIRFRRDTKAVWEQVNPILEEGELGFVLDSDPPSFKLGNGVDHWNDLEPATGLRGPQGETGLQGEVGLQGPKGDKGEKGDIGSSGLQGIQGQKGDKGDAGQQGLKGDKGDTGPQGPPGNPGISADAGAYAIGSFASVLIPLIYSYPYSYLYTPGTIVNGSGLRMAIAASNDDGHSFLGTIDNVLSGSWRVIWNYGGPNLLTVQHSAGVVQRVA